MSKVVNSVMYVFEDVRMFHRTFGHPCPSTPTKITEQRKQARLKWIREEMQEFIDAKNLTEEVDAMIDCMYFVIGTIVEIGMIHYFKEKLIKENKYDLITKVINDKKFNNIFNQISGNLTCIFNDIRYKNNNNEKFPEVPTRIIDKNKYMDNLELILKHMDLIEDPDKRNDPLWIFDSMIIMFYKIIKIFALMGVDPSYPFYLVQQANMNKVWEDGKVHYNDDGKVIKPKGWIAPDQNIKEYLYNIIQKNKYDNNIKKLSEISKFEYNWNGYNAEPISPKIIKRCKDLLKELIIQPNIFPTADNTIQLEWEKGELYIELQLNDCEELFIDITDKNEFHDIKKITNLNMINEIINEYKERLCD